MRKNQSRNAVSQRKLLLVRYINRIFQYKVLLDFTAGDDQLQTVLEKLHNKVYSNLIKYFFWFSMANYI